MDLDTESAVIADVLMSLELISPAAHSYIEVSPVLMTMSPTRQLILAC